jgi:hypothetical protein
MAGIAHGMVAARLDDKLFDRAGGPKDFVGMPQRHHRVRFTMNDQNAIDRFQAIADVE